MSSFCSATSDLWGPEEGPAPSLQSVFCLCLPSIALLLRALAEVLALGSCPASDALGSSYTSLCTFPHLQNGDQKAPSTEGWETGKQGYIWRHLSSASVEVFHFLPMSPASLHLTPVTKRVSLSQSFPLSSLSPSFPSSLFSLPSVNCERPHRVLPASQGWES